eukprot:3349600-Pyramimonas_sp.AAC.1
MRSWECKTCRPHPSGAHNRRMLSSGAHNLRMACAGGNDLLGNRKQIKDQVWKGANETLANNNALKKPVRVVRKIICKCKKGECDCVCKDGYLSARTA